MEAWYQTQLAHGGKLEQVCWVNKRLKKGQIVTLIGDDRTWRVVEQYKTPGEPGRRRWSVGGIDNEIVN